jgi:hypothetical protein
MPRGSRPGERRGGRKKGTPNKATASVKAALLDAFDGTGGVKSLTDWGKENRTEFYKLLVRVIPVEVTGEGGGPIEHAHQVWKLGDKRIAF